MYFLKMRLKRRCKTINFLNMIYISILVDVNNYFTDPPEKTSSILIRPKPRIISYKWLCQF